MENEHKVDVPDYLDELQNVHFNLLEPLQFERESSAPLVSTWPVNDITLWCPNRR